MSETRDQMITIIDSILPIYHERHVMFSNSGEFDLSNSVQQAVDLFENIFAFKKEVLSLDELPFDELMVQEFKACVEKMESGNREVFAKNVNDLRTLLSNHLPLRSRSISAIPSPMNRQVMEELNKQGRIILLKGDSLFANNDPYNEDDFQKANKGLFFSREVYIEQLRTNVVEANQTDLEDCKQANISINTAVGNNFVERIEATDAMLESKIKPQ